MDGIVHYKIVVPLEQKDQQFMQIQNLIEMKKKFLCQKHKNLCLIQKQNHFLDNIKNDYTKYFHYIIQQKYDQMKALELLDNYIKDITLSGELTKQNIEDAKQEQKKIIKELKTIKHNLNNLINEVGVVGTQLKEKHY